MHRPSRLAYLLTAALLAACAYDSPRPRPTMTPEHVDRWLYNVEAMDVRTAERHRVLKTVSDPKAMRAFVSALPLSEFDDIFGESGTPEYEVTFHGPGHDRTFARITFSSTHVRYFPKGAAKLRRGERTAILQALGVETE